MVVIMNWKIIKEIDAVGVLGMLLAFVAWLGAITFAVISFGFYVDNKINANAQQIEFLAQQHSKSEARHDKVMDMIRVELQRLHDKVDGINSSRAR
jgi:hypothetical protein